VILRRGSSRFIFRFFDLVAVDRWVSEGFIANSCGEGKLRTSSSQTDDVNGENRVLKSSKVIVSVFECSVLKTFFYFRDLHFACVHRP